MSWRLLDTGSKTAAENMAIDEVLLSSRAEGLAPNTIRFLQFRPACVLVGYHQAVDQEIRVEYCRSEGIDINRRITGGGALFWDTNQLGWEVVAEKKCIDSSRGVESIYERMCSAVGRSLRRLGINAAYRPRNDIEVNGRKISGTGGTDLGDAFLFQGTLLIDFDVDTMLRALRIPIEKLKKKEIASLKERVTCIKWELGWVPSLSKIKHLLARELATEIMDGHMPTPGELTSYEQLLLKRRLPFFKSDQWINMVEGARGRAELRAARQYSGGLIKVALVLSNNGQIIEQVYLTGDFFAHPQRFIFDLESSLKGLPAEPREIKMRVSDFFSSCRASMPGIKSDDIASTIIDALQRRSYPDFGIPKSSVNEVHAIGDISDVIKNTNYLLLPYCAKMPDCQYRYQQGCSLCGQCDVGIASDIASKYGLKVITIQNYEHLASTLINFKQSGEAAFLGSCCEAFYIKHRHDFDRIGLPGLLVDVNSTTCYELKQENKAHAGTYENRTELKLGLLETVIKHLTVA